MKIKKYTLKAYAIKLEISFLIAFYFTNNRGNRAIALNNFVYYWKKDNLNGITRWICNQRSCNASCLTDTKTVEVLKLNDVSQKNVEDWYSWLKLHKHDPYEDKDLLKFKNWEILKKKAETHTNETHAMKMTNELPFFLQIHNLKC